MHWYKWLSSSSSQSHGDTTWVEIWRFPNIFRACGAVCEFLQGNGKLWLVVVIPSLNKQKEALRRLHEILNLWSTVHDRTPWTLVWFTTKKVREIDEVIYWSRIMVVLWYLMFHSFWGKVAVYESTSMES